MHPVLGPLVFLAVVLLVFQSIFSFAVPLMDGVEVGRHAKVRKAIIDKGVKIPPHAEIGYDLDRDRERFTVTESGIVVVPKGTLIEND